MDTVTDKPPLRKFPAQCWGQDETLTLIAAYRDRWYSLRRGFLRSADWAAVAADVAEISPADPAKTPAQCRHKIEKLRQRYRAEKQKSLSLPSIPFSSSWFFYAAMDEMENGGSISAVGSNPPLDLQGNNNNNNSSVFRIKGIGNQNLIEPMTEPNNLELGYNPNSVNLAIRGKNYGEIEGDHRNPNQGLAYLGDGSDGNTVELVLRPKNSKLGSNPNSVNFAINGKISGKMDIDYRNPNRGYAYLADGSDGDDVDEPNAGSGVRFRIPFEEKLVNPILKAKKFGKIRGDYGANRYCVNGYNEDLPPNPNLYHGDVNSRVNSSIRCEMNTNVSNEVPSFGSGSGKKGVKRERGAIDEIVSSINLLGEGFVRMEKMKMDMAREMEKMRMEMELKRNELILESQRQILDTFVSVMLENNNNNNIRES